MLFREFFTTILCDKRAGSYVISAVILAAASIAVGLTVLTWTQSKSHDYVNQYSETMHVAEMRLGERLVVVYTTYEEDNNEIRIHLFNCGTSDHVKIHIIFIGKGSWYFATSSFTLRFFNDTVIPDQDLDVGENGYVIIYSVLDVGSYYHIRIQTARGAVFDSTFVA